jgi:hypothetical protein
MRLICLVEGPPGNSPRFAWKYTIIALQGVNNLRRIDGTFGRDFRSIRLDQGRGFMRFVKREATTRPGAESPPGYYCLVTADVTIFGCCKWGKGIGSKALRKTRIATFERRTKLQR